ncbi:MAG: TrmH family RNA methyltransferase [Christensenellales bacterium]|jgi:TrmH family RNA methyltransferase
MEYISSTSNQIVQKLRSLKDKKGRVQHGLMLVEGEKLVREALQAGLICSCLLMEEAFWEKFGFGFVAPRRVIESVSDTKTPQGVLGAFSLPDAMDMQNPPNRIVALDGVQDPGNVGAIWRTADAAGFQGLLLGAGCADRFSTKVQRASMGSGLRLPCAETDDLASSLSALRGKGYTVFASTLEGGDFYARRDGGEKFVLVIGSEARGISDAVKKAADALVKLPMRGGAESLNAAVAAGIMMYEMMR